MAPIYEGEFMDIIPGEEAKRENVGAMMAGSPGGARDMRIGDHELRLEKRVALTGLAGGTHLDPGHRFCPCLL